MSFKNCHIPNCIYQALGINRGCPLCRDHFCYHHHENHSCHKGKEPDGSDKTSSIVDWYEPETSQLLDLLDPKLIKAEVEQLKPGHQVSEIHIPATWRKFVAASQGSCNYHIKIDFTDSTSWIMRIRRRFWRNYPDDPLRTNLASEVATCQALNKAGVKVPYTYLRPVNSNLHPKLIYCYQEYVQGDMWRPFVRLPNIKKDPCTSPLDPVSLHHIGSIVQWFLNMEKITWENIGSLRLAENSTITVGPLIERRPVSTVPPYFQGPFRTSQDRWLAVIDHRIKLLLSHNFCEAGREVMFYLVWMETKELIKGCKEMESTGPFYIKHDDDRFDHIRAKEDGEVTGIIDWEWAYTTNKEEAFTAPIGFVPSEYRDGKNDNLSFREIAMIDIYTSLDRPDLAGYINALERAFKDLPDDHPGQPNTMKEWLEIMKDKYKDDVGLRLLMKQC
ncbi:uncharacterized protein L201_002539 [Kwoniella dendrophila CBS 6074]|uniref:Aminoglycoside phosphotransferase domain-containing protein n=1 Tax=Kwoniella dendrophila CBS 6074 TaxID=1295534 RepID=A0AAX4JRX9_9TREE